MCFVCSFKNLIIVILFICHTLNGQSSLINDLEDSSICGLSKNQILDALSDSVKCIATDQKCLEDQLFKNDRCLKEQQKLIECLHKEQFITKEQLINEVVDENSTHEDAKLKFQKIKEQSLQIIADANHELDLVVKDYQETIVQHLKSIDYLTEKIICVDDTTFKLINAKAELATAMRQHILDNIKASRFGVYHEECMNTLNCTQINKQFSDIIK